MSNLDSVQTQKLEEAFEKIREDVAYLHKDIGLAEKNRLIWIFIIMWLVVADLMKNFFDLSVTLSFVASGIIVFAFRLIHGYLITKRALQSLKEPLGLFRDTKVDLS